MVKAIVSFLAVVVIVLCLWSPSSAMSASTEMIVIHNDGRKVKVEDTDGNYYVFIFDKGSNLKVGATVVVEMLLEFKPGNIEAFVLKTMYILEKSDGQ